MAHTTFTNDAVDAAVEQTHDAIFNLWATPVNQVVDLTPLNTAIATLRDLLPGEAAAADRFYTDESADSRDYEKLYEGLSLVAMYTIMDARHLNDAKNLGDLFHARQAAADDVSALASYASNWDWEHGVFVHAGDDTEA